MGDPGFDAGVDEVDELAEAINNMLENLRDLVSHIQNTSGAVASSSTNLSGDAEGVKMGASMQT